MTLRDTIETSVFAAVLIAVLGTLALATQALAG